VSPPPSPEAQARYSRGAVVFHWLIAALILANAALGLSAARAEDEAVQQSLINLHKPLGLTILALSLGRLTWRLTHRPPPFAGIKGWEKALATITHWSFYALMVGVPLAGWWLSSAVPERHTILWFGVIPLPFLPVPQSMPNAIQAHGVHVLLVRLMGVLLLLHLGAVIKHQVFDKTRILARMSFGPGRP
jgi:cytochrome b561